MRSRRRRHQRNRRAGRKALLLLNEEYWRAQVALGRVCVAAGHVTSFGFYLTIWADLKRERENEPTVAWDDLRAELNL